MNGVPVPPHGPIFGQHEAHRLQEAFSTPPGPVFGPKTVPKIKHPQHVFLSLNMGGGLAAWAETLICYT